ncbi:major capsid family protein [Acetobacter tropicalis]|uniref:major capsid family protein n=1 Tax=Acetobacter tropicalis TaxID=104102 RepID=UPI00397535DA
MSLFPSELAELNRLGFIMPQARGMIANALLATDAMALDAQPTLSTSANAGIPAFMSAWVDPALIKVAFAPMRAAELLGEVRKGDWVTRTVIFPMLETTGEISSYGDWNANGQVSLNPSYPERQSYHYQVFLSWGEMELALAGQARLQWVASLREAAALKLNKFQNQTYFFGVSGLRLYGYLNDPRLPAAITPAIKAAGGTTWDTATPEERQDDVIALINQLRKQTAGLVDTETPMVLGLSPTRMGLLTRRNSFGLSAASLLKDTYPNLRFVQAVEYGDATGSTVQTMQIMAEHVDAQKTAETAFTEKLRAHAVVTDASAWKQKLSQGTWGAIIYMPAGIATMTGL